MYNYFPFNLFTTLQHSSHSVYVNTTETKNYVYPYSGTVGVYARTHNNHFGVYADANCPSDPDCGDYVSQSIPLCEIPEPSEILAGPSSSLTLDIGNFNNYFKLGTVSVSSSACNNVTGKGFKNVFARKSFHGRPSYTSKNWGTPDNSTWCCDCDYLGARGNDDLRYTGISGRSYVEYRQRYWPTMEAMTGSATTDQHYISVATSSAVVNPLSGIITYNCNSSSALNTDGGMTSGYSPADAHGALQGCNGNIHDVWYTYCDKKVHITDYMGPPTATTTDGPNAFTIQFNGQYYSGSTTYTYLAIELKVNVDAGTYEYNEWVPNQYPDGHYVVSKTTHDQIELTDTTYHRLQWTHFGDGGNVLTDTKKEVWGTLDSPYSGSQVYEQLKNLLSYWDLTKDYYPWRTDDPLKGPMVCYDEPEGAIVPLLGYDCSETGSNYTGKVLGKPITTGSVDKVWNPAHPNYSVCGYYNNNYYITNFGDYSTSCGVPNATQWLSYRRAIDTPQGAYLQFERTNDRGIYGNRMQDGVLYGAKWAETVEQHPSWNWARPCGADRFLVSANSASCGYATDNVFYPSSPVPFESNTKCLVIGTGTVDGVWSVTVDNPYQVTLTTLLISGSQVQTDLLTQSDYISSVGFIAPLWFPNARPICSKLDISSLSTTSPVTCSLADHSYLVNGDTVWAFKADGSHDVKTVTVIDPTHVVLNSTTVGTAYTYLTSPNPPDFKWDTETPKGNATAIEFTFNYRDIGEWQRLKGQYDGMVYPSHAINCNPYNIGACPNAVTASAEPRASQSIDHGINGINCIQLNNLFASRCGHAVVCISPNGENFGSNGVTLEFPSDFALDTIYGSQWQTMVKSTMNDLLYQPVPSCLLNYQPQTTPKKYEAVCSPPSGSPALPAGIYVGCATLDQFEGDYIPPNGCYPPNIGVTTWQPWNEEGNPI